jgi:hypothetical protein
VVRAPRDPGKGLGDRLLAALDATVAELETDPNLGSPIVQAPPLRRLQLDGFPFWVILVELEDETFVLAVARDRQHPRQWLERLPRV